MADEDLGMLVEKADSEVATGESGEPQSLRQRYLLQFRVFRLQQQIEKQIRQETPPAQFKEAVKRLYIKYFPHSKEPGDKVLDFIYERAVDAAVSYRHARECDVESGRRGWKKHRQWTRAVTDLVELLEERLKAADPERVSSTVLAEIEKALPRLDQLEGALREMSRFDDRLPQFVEFSNKNLVVTETQTSLRRMLAKYRSDLPQDARSALIVIAMQAIGLGQVRKNQSKSPITIVRNLRRHDARLKPKNKKAGMK